MFSSFDVRGSVLRPATPKRQTAFHGTWISDPPNCFSPSQTINALFPSRSSAIYGNQSQAQRKTDSFCRTNSATLSIRPSTPKAPSRAVRATSPGASAPRARTPRAHGHSNFNIFLASPTTKADESVCSSNDVSACPSETSTLWSKHSVLTTRKLFCDEKNGPLKTPQKLARRWDSMEFPQTTPRLTHLCLSAVGADQLASPTASQSPLMSPLSPINSVTRRLLSHFVDTWTNKYQENQNNYREGGYLAVNVGEILHHRYLMMHKLGWGEFSTVWLAYDHRAQELHHSFVAIKIAKCHSTVAQSTKYEINLLKHLKETKAAGAPLTLLLDAFEHRGPYGYHLCMVMPVHGSNLLAVIDQMKAKKRKRSEKELQMIKEITGAVLLGLHHLESVNVIHTDLKPENVLSAAPDPKIVQIVRSFCQKNQGRIPEAAQTAFEQGDPCTPLVSLADFGLSVLLEPQTAEAAKQVGNKKEFRVCKTGIVANSFTGTLIQTREYRAPEILFGADFCPRSDVWSLGCMVYELITGDFLMDPKRKTRVEREMDVEHLAMMAQILGPVPLRIAASHRSSAPPRYISRYFTEQGQFLFSEKYKHYPRRSIAAELEMFLEPSEAERAAQFIMSCFTYDPMERCHPGDLLRHSWLKSLQF